jgi:hypothetical protein
MYYRSLKYTPGDFRVETTFNIHNRSMQFILEIPLLKVLISEILVRQGKIFLRPLKVAPSKPEQYWVEGFKVRNKSQRQDGTYLTAGNVTRFKASH